MATILIAMCRDETTASNCVNALQVAGLGGDNIGLVAREHHRSRELADALGVRAGLVSGDSAAVILEEIREWIEGLTHPSDEEEGWGEGLVEQLKVRGASDEGARWCRDQVTAGAVLLTVRADEEESDDVADLLGDCEAQVVKGGPAGIREQRAPLREEAAGGAHRPTRQPGAVEKERPPTQIIYEDIVVERRPANRATEQGVGEVETIRIPLREERVELVREPRVVEDVILRKRVVSKQRFTAEAGTAEEAGAEPHAQENSEDTLKEREVGGDQ